MQNLHIRGTIMLDGVLEKVFQTGAKCLRVYSSSHRVLSWSEKLMYGLIAVSLSERVRVVINET